MENPFILARDLVDGIIKEFDIKIKPDKRIDLISDVYDRLKEKKTKIMIILLISLIKKIIIFLYLNQHFYHNNYLNQEQEGSLLM